MNTTIIFLFKTISVILIMIRLSAAVISAQTIEEYQQNRTRIIEEELTYFLGGNLKLSEEESRVNDILMKLKDKEVNNSFYNPENFDLSKHYFTYKNHLERSEVYQIIKRMPKGGALHVHSLFVLDTDYLLNLTYEDHLYACTENGYLKLLNFGVSNLPCTSGNWTLLSELRYSSENVTKFDLDLKKRFQIITEDTDAYNHIDKIWQQFEKVDTLTKRLVTYRPVREKYIYDTLQKMYDDNVLYVEMRSGIHLLYELNGTSHDGSYMIKLHEDITNRFIKDNPEFIGMKFVLTKNRLNNDEIIRKAMNNTINLKKEFPQMVAGFDLVGQEDNGRPLIDFLPDLLNAKDSINFYFHAGETNWFGTSSDDNLVDAILLGTKRIGHGFALTKHPVLLNMVIKMQIAVEVNVISNAILALVSDVRNHPLATFLSLGVPVVLSSDDPGMWGAEPLSHDFYIAFVAVASKRADIRLLKQLAFNSIQFSALDNKRKVHFTKVFNKRWNAFLGYVIDHYA